MTCLALVTALVIGTVQPASSPPATTDAVTARAVEAANAFLATLSDAERGKATFPFNSSQRTGWSNLPSGIFQRNGLRLGDLTSRQRAAAPAPVAAVGRRPGYQKLHHIPNGGRRLHKA